MTSPRFRAITARKAAVKQCESSRRLAAPHRETGLFHQLARPRYLLAWVWVVCLAVSGCKSILKTPFTSSPAGDATTRRLASTDDIHGPLERALLASGKGHPSLPSTSSKGLARYEAADKLYKTGQYKQAEKSFKAIAKQYKQTQVQEDALFMTAESQFQRKRYPWAQDSYDRLLKEFPSTRYLDRVSRRKFEIARIWLRFPTNINTSDIQPVNFDNPLHSPPPKSSNHTSYDPSRLIPIFPNFWDRSRPVFDTHNRALESLKSIWIKDPTGPLADDALMMTAGYYVRAGNYAEAAHVFATLRDQYPQSPYLEKAYIIGSQMTLVSHQGPAYDSSNLDEAEKLKSAALRLFPKTIDRDRLRDELRKINEAKAREQWVTALFWKKKSKPQAVAIYCRRVIDNYPKTKYAALARDLLAEVDPHTAVSPQTQTSSPPIPKTTTPKTPRRFIPFLPRRIGLRSSHPVGQSAPRTDRSATKNPFQTDPPPADDPDPTVVPSSPAEEPPGRVRL